MDKTTFNRSYWENYPGKDIPGNNVYPGNEIFSRIPKNASILDVGCGTGGISEFLSRKGYDVTAIDINRDSIRNGQHRKSHVRYELGNILEDPKFELQSFDAIIFGFVMVNIVNKSDRETAIKNVYRLLKPGGFVWVNEGLVSDDYNIRYKLCKPILRDEHTFFVFTDRNLSKGLTTTAEIKTALNNDLVERIAHHFTPEELKRLLSQFKIVDSHNVVIESPRSHSKINSIVIVAQKY